jgi:hypothetical protein
MMFVKITQIVFFLLWQMSSSGNGNTRWWNKKDDSDVEDLLFIEGLREGSRRSKRKKHGGSLSGATTCQET